MATLINNHIRAFGLTDQGMMRSDNEDSLMVDLKRGVYAVADGLGGLPEGSMASALATDSLIKQVKKLKNGDMLDFDPLFTSINTDVFHKGQQISSEMGIGTTLTVAQIKDLRIHVGHVGDSGIVIFNSHSWRQITRDHTMAQDMLDRLRPGEHAFIPDYFSHTLTRCIGQLAQVDVDTYEYVAEPGERMLMFSDGVTKTMNMDEVHEEILKADDPRSFVEELIKTANERGGPDNVTAIALFFD